MRAPVHRDDAPVAVLLVEDRHEARALHDAVVAAVRALPHHRRDAVGQAAFAGVRVEERLVGSDAVARARRARRPSAPPACTGICPSCGSTIERRLLLDLSRPPVVLPEAVVLVAANRRLRHRAASHRGALGAGEPLRRLLLLGLLRSGRLPRRSGTPVPRSAPAAPAEWPPRSATRPGGPDRPTACAAVSTLSPACGARSSRSETAPQVAMPATHDRAATAQHRGRE